MNTSQDIKIACNVSLYTTFILPFTNLTLLANFQQIENTASKGYVIRNLFNKASKRW